MTGTLHVHPWSAGFEWQDHAGPFRRVTPEQAEAFDRDGCFVLDDAIDAEQLQALTAAIDPLEARSADALRSRGGREVISDVDAITFTAHLVVQDPVLAAFATSPLFQDLCFDLIGPDARLYWDQSVYKKPETPREFPWHQDNGYTFVQPEAYLTCWIPLVDATVDNGCPWVVPGLHRGGTLSHDWTDIGFQCLQDPAGAVPVPAPAGSIVVFSSLTPHRTGPNLTGETRKAYILQYAPEGAEILRGRPGDGEPTRITVNTEPRQLPVLAGGRPVSPA